MKKTVAIILISILLFLFSSCKQEVDVKIYKVCFDSNGATEGEPPKPSDVPTDETFIVPNADSLGKDGYVFKDWNTLQDGTGTSFKEGDSILVEQDITLYAQWDVTPFEFTYLAATDSYYIAYRDGKLGKNLVLPSSYRGKPVAGVWAEGFASYSYDDIESITFPESIQRIGELSFVGLRKSLKTVVLNSSLCENGMLANVFFYDNVIENVVIPESASKIGESLFGLCENIKSVSIPDNIVSIGKNAFFMCEIEKISIPNSVRDLGEGVFFCCSSLKQISLPKDIVHIPRFCFGNCYNLTRITIPSNVTTIGEYAFLSCRKLSQIKIPASVTEIYSDAFYDCPSLSIINYGSTMDDWNAIKKYDDSFANCTIHCTDGDILPNNN